MRTRICENNVKAMVHHMRSAARHLRQQRVFAHNPDEHRGLSLHINQLETDADYLEKKPPFDYETPKSDNPPD